MNVLKGRKEFTANIVKGATHTSIFIMKNVNIEENELWYSNSEFDSKGIAKVLKENGYKLKK